VARDRKRAKQRQQRRAKTGTVPPESHLRRENVPGSLEHASGEVEEFDAGLVAGAQGELADVDDAEPEEAGGPEPLADEPEIGLDGGAARDGSENGDAAVAEERRGPTATGTLAPRPRAGAASRPARADGENRVVAFLRASWSELQRVQWPDRRQVVQATAVVLGFVAIAGAYLGVADWVAGKIVNAIL